jgi:site-specific DNA recombinase
MKGSPMAKLNLKSLVKHSVKIHKVGIYIRVSTEEQASNPEGSIKSQEQRLRQHVDFKNLESPFGEVAQVFVDRAKSGKDTNRPELKKLLLAVHRKEISLVMVTELSRLSRSIKDVCEIWELMRANGCEFLSLREQFDTTTAAGEMVLYTIANIAQFERKQTSERIVANFHARAERGLFNGGSVPLGYNILPEKKGFLFVNEEEAALVREIFKTFLDAGYLSKTGKLLNDRGFRLPRKRKGAGKPRMGHFTIKNTHEILTNACYIAQRRVIEKSGESKMVKACWPAIIDEITFERVQKILKKNRHSLKISSETRYPYVLTGSIICGKCGDRLIGKSANGNGGKIPYYEHGWSTKRQACLTKKVFTCAPARIQSKKIEPWIWENMLKLISDPKVAEDIIVEANLIHQAQAHITEADQYRSKMAGIDEQTEALAEHLSKIPKGISPAPIFAQMQRLQEHKTIVQKELEKIMSSGDVTDFPASLKDYKNFCELIHEALLIQKDQDLRQRVIQMFVHKIEILPESYRLHYYVGKSHIERFKDDKNKSETSKSVAQKAIDGPDAYVSGAHGRHSDFFWKFGSNRLQNGAGDGSRTRNPQLGRLIL